MTVKSLILLLCLFCITSVTLKAQESEAKQKAEADAFFSQGKYTEALPLYSQLLAVHSDDAAYNYRYGVCLLFADRRDLSKPQKFIEKSSNSTNKDPLFGYFAGLACWYNDNFEKAVTYLRAYKGKPDPVTGMPTVNEIITHCENGKLLPASNRIASIISTFEASAENFHRSYSQDELPGKIISRPTDCTSSIDNEKEPDKVIFLSEPREHLYYSSFGDDPSGSRDIYCMSRLPDGEWGQPVKLGPTVNTELDEDYPVLINNGKTLLFSSKGHNSIGGYDIFMCDLNPGTGEWNAPVNIGLKINSAFDDFMFIPGIDPFYAWFTSNRATTGNALKVYRVKLAEPVKIKAGDQISTPEIASDHEIKQADDIPSIKNENPESENENKLRDKQRANMLVDSAFSIAQFHKDQLKKLRSLKDEAFTIANDKSLTSGIKGEEANVHFNNAKFTQDENIALQELALANQLKTESLFLLSRSDHSKKIGQQLNRQISLRQKIAENAETQAAALQLTSAQSGLDAVEKGFARLVTDIKLADTLKDYRHLLTAVKNDETHYNIDLSKNLFTLEKDFTVQKQQVKNEQPVALKESDTKKINQQKIQQPDEKKVISDNQGMSEAEKTKLENDVAHYVSFIESSRVKLEQNSILAVISAKKQLDYFNKRMKMLYDTYKADEKIAGSLPDSLELLLDPCRKAVAYFKIYQFLDSISSIKKEDFIFADEIKNFIGSENHNEAKKRLSKLISLSGKYVNETDPVKQFTATLPEPRESALGQAKQYSDLALKYEQEYEQLMDEGDEVQAKADKRKDGSKKEELQKQAEDLYEKAQLKKENADKNSIKARNARNSYYHSLNFSRYITQAIASLNNSKMETNTDLLAASGIASSISVPVTNFEKNLIFIDTTAYLLSLFNGFESPETPVFARNILNLNGLNYKLNTYNEIARLAQTQIGLLTSIAGLSNEPKVKTYSNSKISSINNDLFLNQKLIENIKSRISLYDNKPSLVSFGDIPDDSLYIRSLREKLSDVETQYQAWNKQLEQGTGIYSKEYSESYIKGLESQLSELKSESDEINRLWHYRDYLKGQLYIEHLTQGVSNKEVLKQAGTKIDEAAFLFQKARTNRDQSGEKSGRDRYYLLSDANTFELAALEQQQAAIVLLKKYHPRSADIFAALESNIYSTELLGVKADETAIASQVDKKITDVSVEKEASTTQPKQLVNNKVNTAGGVIYRVQLLATGKTMKQEELKGITPITIEKASPTVNRYLGGEFSTVSEAQAAREQYQKLGFSSAFVVAYHNGARISLQEAAKFASQPEKVISPEIKEQPIAQNTEIAMDNKPEMVIDEKIPPPAKATENKTLELKKDENPVPEVTAKKEIPVALNKTETATPSDNNILKFTGAAWFIQMGIFNGPKTSSSLFGVDPLYHEITQDGKYKYYAGPFDDKTLASKKRAELESKGCKGAFMVAWNNGRKIKPDEMPEIKTGTVITQSEEKVAEVIPEPKKEEPVPVIQKEINKTEPKTDQKAVIGPEPEIKATTPVVTFAIQLGAFKEAKPDTWIQDMMKKTGSDVKQLKQASGVYLAVCGSFGQVEEATGFKNQLVSKGFKDVFIIGIKDGQKMNLQQAVEISRKQ